MKFLPYSSRELGLPLKGEFSLCPHRVRINEDSTDGRRACVNASDESINWGVNWFMLQLTIPPVPFPIPVYTDRINGYASDDAYFSRESPNNSHRMNGRVSKKSSPYRRVIDVINAYRHASPAMCHVPSSNAFYVRVFKRVTTLQLRRVSGSRSEENNRHTPEPEAFSHRRTFYRRRPSLRGGTRPGVLFSAWHPRILLVTEQTCAVIVWEIRCRGNDRSQNGHEVAVPRRCEPRRPLPKQRAGI